MTLPDVSPARLLEVWERGKAESAGQRGLTLLAAACPERRGSELMALPIGRRDALLLDLRQTAFGGQLESLVDCPQCGETLEIAMQVADLRLPDQEERELELEHGDFSLRFRLPSSADLLALEELAPAGSSVGPADGNRADGERQWLLDRCLLEARQGEQGVSLKQLPDEVQAAMVKAMEDADPQSHPELAFTCPECQHQWARPFDIVSYLWTELDSWARRLLYEVHVLARAYGWAEQEIIALSTRRRRLYLEWLGA